MKMKHECEKCTQSKFGEKPKKETEIEYVFKMLTKNKSQPSEEQLLHFDIHSTNNMDSGNSLIIAIVSL